jgi:hypothetical protein
VIHFPLIVIPSPDAYAGEEISFLKINLIWLGCLKSCVDKRETATGYQLSTNDLAASAQAFPSGKSLTSITTGGQGFCGASG